MYIVMGHDLITGHKTVYAELTDPAKAYELAHELDAATNLGRDDDEETNKTDNPMMITIEDENGNNVWKECCNARCSVFGMFQ